MFRVFTGKGDPSDPESTSYEICTSHDPEFVRKRFSSLGGGAYRIRGVFKCKKCGDEWEQLTDRYQWSTSQYDRTFELKKVAENDGMEMLLPNTEDGALQGSDNISFDEAKQ